MGVITLVLGGARSGKSAHAQALAEANPGELVFVATAEAMDDEMAERIARHRADRGPRWRTVNAPLTLSEVVVRERCVGRTLLVDCLTVWLGNLMHYEIAIKPAVDALLYALRTGEGNIILVSNEVGLGLVPETPLGRSFRDEAGRLNQCVAQIADRAILIVSGLEVALKTNAAY